MSDDLGIDDRFDVAVVGAGFGGMGAALACAETGLRVVIFEALNYPGGCAATFARDGYRFEAGATLFSGLGADQLFGRWITRHGLPVTVDWIDPVVTFRTEDLELEIGRDRDAFITRLCALDGAPAVAIRKFFAWQARLADDLWDVILDPTSLPPFSLRAVIRHALQVRRNLSLTRLAGRSLAQILDRFGLAGFVPLRRYLDGLCQITVQCPAAEAEAPFALAVMDYYWRGTGHVRGGIGELARGLTDAIGRLGGVVRMPDRVTGIRPHGDGWRVEGRGHAVVARNVIANVLPGSLLNLAPSDALDRRRLDRLDRDVRQGWGAVMLYLVAKAPADAAREPRHLELVATADAPYTEGNHVFVSISGADDVGRCPPGFRTLTVSTHAPLRPDGSTEADWADAVARIQARMRATLALRAPEWDVGIVHSMTASPRTFERFTGRGGGAVGGIPRRVGLRQYLALGPVSVAKGLWLVGDSTFLGQSILAAATSGVRVAHALRPR